MTRATRAQWDAELARIDAGIAERERAPRCACAHNSDGSVTTMLCPLHSDTDPCLTMARVTGRRRRGTIRQGRCTNCGHVTNREEVTA